MSESSTGNAGLPQVVQQSGIMPWSIRKKKGGGEDREYVFRDESVLPAGIPHSEGAGFRSKSSAYLAKRLLNSLGAPVVYHDGRILLYCNGAFRDIGQDELREIFLGWDGRRVGERDFLLISHSKVSDVIRCLIDLLRHPSSQFFKGAPRGLAFRNAFVRLVNGALALVEHSPANRALHWIDAHAEPNPTCPRFDQFLDDVLRPKDGFQDFTQRKAALLQWLGIALLGLAPSFGKALLVHGAGGTGKSTLLEIISELWLSDLRSSFPFHALEDKFDRARLAGKRLNVCGELPSADAKSVEMIKAIITGRDEIEARHLYERGFSFRPEAAHVFAANQLPIINDPSGAFYDRFLILCMQNRFRGTQEENRSLAKDIIATELGAIALKALMAAIDAIQENHIVEPASSIAALEDWRGSSEPVHMWLAECCKVDPTLTSGGMPGSDAYSHFKEWLARNGYRTVSVQDFATRLRSMGVERRRKSNCNVWGITFAK